MLKLIAWIIKYWNGKDLVVKNEYGTRSALTNKYIKVKQVKKPVRFYTDFHSEECWGKN
jgi:hypothetical protein